MVSRTFLYCLAVNFPFVFQDILLQLSRTVSLCFPGIPTVVCRKFPFCFVGFSPRTLGRSPHCVPGNSTHLNPCQGRTAPPPQCTQGQQTPPGPNKPEPDEPWLGQEQGTRPDREGPGEAPLPEGPGRTHKELAPC